MLQFFLKYFSIFRNIVSTKHSLRRFHCIFKIISFKGNLVFKSIFKFISRTILISILALWHHATSERTFWVEIKWRSISIWFGYKTLSNRSKVYWSTFMLRISEIVSLFLSLIFFIIFWLIFVFWFFLGRSKTNSMLGTV